MKESRAVVLRLTGSPDTEGFWIEFPDQPLSPAGCREGLAAARMVPTGRSEWGYADRYAEVYVPEGRLAEYLSTRGS